MYLGFMVFMENTSCNMLFFFQGSLYLLYILQSRSDTLKLKLAKTILYYCILAQSTSLQIPLSPSNQKKKKQKENINQKTDF